MAPRFAPGDDILVRDRDGREVAIHVDQVHELDGMIVGRPFGLDTWPYDTGVPMIFPAAGARPITAEVPGWQHPDGLVIFAGMR